MSMTITNNYTGNVGRMFARQNVNALYGVQKASGAGEAEAADGMVDRVSLSAFAPKPLTTGFLDQALSAGKSLGEGQPLSDESTTRLREDRIFAAVTALALMGYDESNGSTARWPGGIPAPTSEEMEVAKRRLSQRPYADSSVDASRIQDERVELLQRLGRFEAVNAGVVQAVA